MEDHLEVEISVSYAWWLMPYFYLLASFCAITGMEPDEEKLTRIIDRAIKLRADIV